MALCYQGELQCVPICTCVCIAVNALVTTCLNIISTSCRWYCPPQLQVHLVAASCFYVCICVQAGPDPLQPISANGTYLTSSFGFINVCHLCVCGVWLWGSSLEATFLFTNHSVEILQPLFGHRSCVNIQNWDDYDVWTCRHSLEPSNLRKRAICNLHWWRRYPKGRVLGGACVLRCVAVGRLR